MPTTTDYQNRLKNKDYQNGLEKDPAKYVLQEVQLPCNYIDGVKVKG